MPKKQIRYQIFVSSTYIDLIEERQAAVEAILRAGHIPAGMELFAAQNRPQMEVIEEWIEESDIFCLILGARYGSIEPVSGRSYVECEYEYATKLGKPVFSLVLEESRIDANVQSLGRRTALEQEHESLLKSFRSRLTDTLVRMVGSSDAIKVAVFEAIGTLERKYDIEGWVRAKDAQMSPKMGEELARLSSENAHLSKELSAARTSKESLIAGKSYEDWATILSQSVYRDWDSKTNAMSATGKITLLGALRDHGERLGAGVDNSLAAGPYRSWLFAIANALASLGLAETRKAPASVHWTRLGLSAVGKQLHVEMVSRHANGTALVSLVDVENQISAGLLEALESMTYNKTVASEAPAESSPRATAPAERQKVTTKKKTATGKGSS